METDEDALEYCMVRFIQLYASDERFTKSFRLDSESPNDFYKWPGLRYFLMNYEENCQPNKTIPIDKILLGTKDGKTADYLSVEHLWATNNRSGEGENSRKQDRFERRRLGNFVLLELRLNIQESADDLEHKIDWYRGGPRTEPPTDLEHVRYAADDADTVLKELQGREKTLDYYLDLHRKLNDLQEDRYCRFAESRWSLKDYLGNGHVQKESLELAAEEA